VTISDESADGHRIFIVVPAFNEGPVLSRVLAELKAKYRAIVLVDDCSTDGTGDIAESAGAIVVRHPINLGQGAALQTGIDYALARAADIIVTFDADGQHRTSDISALVAALQATKADFALGSRFLGKAINMPASRRLLLQTALWFTRLTTGLRLTDAHNGLRAMTRHGASRLRIRQNRMAHASEILEQIAQSGLKFVEVPVTVEYTRYSLAKGQKMSNLLNILIDLAAGRLQR
jgi:glycosyltransferase involved in cell wall biosynthesis